MNTIVINWVRFSPQAPGMDPNELDQSLWFLSFPCYNTKTKRLPLSEAVPKHWLLTYTFSGANQDRSEMWENTLGLFQDSKALLCLTDHTNCLGGTRGQGFPESPAHKSTASDLFSPHAVLSMPASEPSSFLPFDTISGMLTKHKSCRIQNTTVFWAPLTL